MSDPRDTQFAGFAKALLNEMIEEEFGQIQVNAFDTGKLHDLEQIIARRAYDLVKHAMNYEFSDGEPVTDIRFIPDLTQWPEVKS